MLAADRQGRIAIIEFKKGPENPDVRKVVAQLLDYGSALWQTTVEELSRLCHLTDSLATHVERALDEEEFDPDAFESGLQGTLSNGDFVYFYVARVLDSRTRRVLTYLGDGVRLPFIAVEADRFVDGETAVVAPRPAFVPGWMIASGGATRTRPSAAIPASEVTSVGVSPCPAAGGRARRARARSLVAPRRTKLAFVYSMDGGFPGLDSVPEPMA